ncbi:MAG: helix-turn-helix domain-containing protein [Lachnospiraceae bacterium]|nr:helix-turn-helix domain-containing protein [Lachnospiraceae bacterium]
MMRKPKNVLKEPLQSEQEFAVFLKRVREESGVTGEELSKGLMDASQLSRIESEIRPVPKTMRDCLLGRLGVTPNMYENLLNNEDHAEWEWQHRILWAIVRRDFPMAGNLIRDYGRQDPADRLRRQFCLMMCAECLKLQGADRTELARLYGEAVRLTVPEVEQVYTQPKLLSVLEVNMVLEYECYRESASGFADKCRYWLAYVKDSLYDELSMAKIYPRIVYYYLREILTNDHAMAMGELQQVLLVCDDVIELLRDTGRAFYLVELLEYRGRILTSIVRQLTERGKQQEAAAYQTVLQESAELEKLMKELYAEYDVPVYMQDCTYLYRQRWVYAVGDVLRIRRTMLGLTQEELCEGICSVKSLRRAEQRKMNMQREPLGKILGRLGLSREVQKTALVTNDRSVLELMTELTYSRNNRDPVKARMLLERLKAKVCLEIPENEQYVMEAEASLDLMEGKITQEAFAVREQRALQCTLDVKRILDAKGLYELDEVYLTETEMTCIRQRIHVLDHAEKRKLIDFLLRFFERFEKENRISDYIVMYEFVMESAASQLGNMGEYQLATELDRKALRAMLRCRRIYMVHAFLYDMLWNEEEQQSSAGWCIEKEKVADSLRKCIIFSHFCKKTFYEKIYRKK